MKALRRIVGSWPVVLFAGAGSFGALAVLELFGLPVWPAVVIAFVFSYCGEMIFTEGAAK